MKRFSRVLVAVDFSKPARGAFEYALALSKQHGAELIAIQAVPLNQAFGWQARERYALTARLHRKAELAKVEFKNRVQQGDPAKIILLHAGSLHPDVIVIGTHQRSGIDRLGTGSVAERVAASVLRAGPGRSIQSAYGCGHVVPPSRRRRRWRRGL